LPEYMVPAAIVRIDHLPMTPNGKLDRKALPKSSLHERSTEPADRQLLPQTATQRIIRDAWEIALGTKDISIFDNFFDIGGHSLLIHRVYVELRKVFGGKLRVTDLFTYPTIASLAEYLTANHSEIEVQGEADFLDLIEGRERLQQQHPLRDIEL